MKTKPYTVLLNQPDTIADQYGEDYCLVQVAAKNVASAEEAAQLMAASTLGGGEDDIAELAEAFGVIAVFPGHLENVRVGRWGTCVRIGMESGGTGIGVGLVPGARDSGVVVAVGESRISR